MSPSSNSAVALGVPTVPLFRRLGAQARISLALSAVTAIFAIGYIRATAALPTPQLVDPVGPRAFPYLIGAGLLICAAGLLVEGLVLFRDEPAVAGAGFDLADPRYRIAAGVMGWTLAYYLAFGPLGYMLATGLFLAGLIYVFDGRRLRTTLTVAPIFAVASFYLFNNLLDVFLPAGTLFGFR
ncbi:tripartite tricarboxylate transporter TctB family protein [Ancylobacter sonchi]|uniref:tripartite tricarboxylate transporter TctB family protein n=1 Tax=Ancylobacter sonchi TaxID=1937790 RepID=UPI001BD53E26|nr:tripartite tricarboxylate transporter TctB family protein [Ancylobacter sonchi]MBS7534691.1 tripartite tricarboxylate transporter TctB family protein [Ancylobacter sonchi]